MRKFDFSNPDLWKYKAGCWFPSNNSEESADFWAMVMDDIHACNNGGNAIDVWNYDMAKAAVPEDSRFALRGTCDHCGAHFNYGAAYEHVESGDVAIVGNICAMNSLPLNADEYADRKMRVAVKAARSRKVADAAWDDLSDEQKVWLMHNHYISNDLKGKFRKYQNLSDRQWKLAKKIYNEHLKREAEKAAEPKPDPIPEELLEGRHSFSGVILGTKWQDNMYGGSLKMLFRDDRNFKLWGTMPSSLDAEKNDRIKFDAAVNVSNDDDCFGFFSRPTKAEVLEYAPPPDFDEEEES